jgi:hypothetical protein
MHLEGFRVHRGLTEPMEVGGKRAGEACVENRGEERDLRRARLPGEAPAGAWIRSEPS